MHRQKLPGEKDLLKTPNLSSRCLRAMSGLTAPTERRAFLGISKKRANTWARSGSRVSCGWQALWVGHRQRLVPAGLLKQR